MPKSSGKSSSAHIPRRSSPADENAVFGAAGLPFSAPIAVKALNTPAISCYLESIPAKSHLVVYGETLHHYTENGEIAIPQEIEVQLRSIYAAVCESAGKLDENGDRQSQQNAEHQARRKL